MPALVPLAAADTGSADANRFAELEMLILVAERGSLSAAARHLGISPSAVSKLITRIEDRLGTRLVVRSTRSLQLTPEGEVIIRNFLLN